jgi:hypothetical protein
MIAEATEKSERRPLLSKDRRKREDGCQSRENAWPSKLGKQRGGHKLRLVGAVDRSDCQAYRDSVLLSIILKD